MATQLDNIQINFLKNEPTSIVNKINKEINNKIVTLFSGKITTCVEAAKKIEKIFEKN